ncbi:MAG: HAD family hydrolase [Lachnospiraceae bacterium]|nr:HAD family hydrolase [Lachnospiraceae bacterium]
MVLSEKKSKTELKTLYVSDLDGTLMRNDETLSEHTIQTINGLIERGVAFTYATARSIESALPIAGGLRLRLPVITRNGAVLADNMTGRHLEKSVFSAEEVSRLKELLPELPKYGFVSCFFDEEMHRLYVDCEHVPELQGYLDYYEQNPTVRAVADRDELFDGVPGYVTLIGAKEEIRPVYERVKQYDGWESLFQKDTYRDEYWLEICPQNCTKAKTIKKLKERYGFQRLVVFGDGLNDIPMFRIADESYAVANALDELKQIATAVIGRNEEDAVADFIREHSKIQQ